MRMPKVYRATVKLGVETSTCDYTGETLSSSCWRGVSNDDIDHTLAAFIGWRLQTPPKVSAVHIGGRRAHEVFRSGGDPDIEPRAVFIEHIQRLGPLSYKGEFGILIKCGKGVYIRSIARDVGRALGCGAHLSSLTRESVGGFTLHSALKFDGNRCLDFDNLRSFLMPLTVLEEFLPTYSLPEEGMTRLSNGLGVSFSLASRRTFGKFPPNGALAFSSGPLLSIAHLESREGELYALPDVNIFDKTTTGTHI
jgi:tRNA pseudouridine(55) synthase